MFVIIGRCSKCGEESELGVISGRKSRVLLAYDGNPLVWKCPKCGKRHEMHLEDEESEAVLNAI